MKPIFHPHLVNDPFGDPALYIEFLFEKRAFLFDLGDLHALPPKKVLRLSDIFVSHTHMDHFIGFDQVLRLLLGREKVLYLYGPEGFIHQVGCRLQGYTWNLVQNYAADFTLVVTEVLSEREGRRARFRCRTAFEKENERIIPLKDGVLLDEPGFRVRTAILDHRIPCLAFALEEKLHVNVWKNRLASLGLSPGPWLKDLKEAVLEHRPSHTPIPLPDGRTLPLGELSRQVLRIVPGQKIGYVVDTLYREDNVARILELVRDADILFIEASFLDEEAQRAAEKYHLTARQAGTLARLARVQRLLPFHFSAKYSGEGERLRREAMEAWKSPAGDLTMERIN